MKKVKKQNGYENNGYIELGTEADYSVDAFFQGANVTDAPLYAWDHGYAWTVEFAGRVGPQPLLDAREADLWAGTSPTLNVDRVRPGQAPLRGTFRLGFDGETSRPLGHAATAGEVEAAMSG